MPNHQMNVRTSVQTRSTAISRGHCNRGSGGCQERVDAVELAGVPRLAGHASVDPLQDRALYYALALTVWGLQLFTYLFAYRALHEHNERTDPRELAHAHAH